jgi:hypothetical protein
MISNLGKKLQILDFLIEKYHESIFFNDIGNLSPSEVLRFTIEIYLENNQNDIQNKNEHMLLLHQIIAGEFSLNLVKFFLDALPGSCKLQDVNGMPLYIMPAFTASMDISLPSYCFWYLYGHRAVSSKITMVELQRSSLEKKRLQEKITGCLQCTT